MYKNKLRESSDLNLYFCWWLDVTQNWAYSLLLNQGWFALSQFAQMANWYQRFLQWCLQVARRSVWKHITDWFYSTEQSLLGFIKCSLPSKQYLSSTCSTYTGSPQEAALVAAPINWSLSKYHLYVFWNIIHLRYCKVSSLQEVKESVRSAAEVEMGRWI